MSYQDDIAPPQAWEKLQNNPDAKLIDVRTNAEWCFVGVPNLSPCGKEVICVEWVSFPTMQANGNFLQQMQEQGITPDDELLFLCRSGQRSGMAASFMTAQGYKNCFNVAQGFDGDLDDKGARGQVNGWKKHGLPWVQS